MKKAQIQIEDSNFEQADWNKLKDVDPQLIFAFGHPKYFSDSSVKQIKEKFPNSEVILPSTGGV